mmetsp:Transcript_147931/g.473561  ORF Transcript_147931/g.473561 Transcript_147931/m.473561 type:complete len:883 (-) Transcript_147931:32-2680(-)
MRHQRARLMRDDLLHHQQTVLCDGHLQRQLCGRPSLRRTLVLHRFRLLLLLLLLCLCAEADGSAEHAPAPVVDSSVEHAPASAVAESSGGNAPTPAMGEGPAPCHGKGTTDAGRIARVARPDLPLPSALDESQWDKHLARLEYSGIFEMDFRVSETTPGGLEAVALPRRGRELETRWRTTGYDAEGWDGPVRRFRLRSMRVRTPSEHLLNGSRFDGELQFYHEDGDGAAMVVSWFLQGVPRYKLVHYPEDCPDPYSEIQDQFVCKQAAVNLHLLSAEEVVGEDIVGLKDSHRKSGCWATFDQSVNGYEVQLDPLTGDLNIGVSVQLCQMATSVSDWITTLALKDHVWSHRMWALLDSRCSWLQTLLDSRCSISYLPASELVPTDGMRAIRYMGRAADNSGEVRTSSRITMHFQPPRQLTNASLKVAIGSSGHNLVVSSVRRGPIAEWNAAHPSDSVQVGDRLVSIDGFSTDAHDLLGLLQEGARVSNVTVEREAETSEGSCGRPVEWLVAMVPLPVELWRLAQAQAGGRVDWQQLGAEIPDSALSDLEVVMLLPQLTLLQAIGRRRAFLAWLGSLSVFLAAALLAWNLQDWEAEYEPDLAERSEMSKWALTREHTYACVAGALMIPCFLSQHLDEAEASGMRMPFACHMYLNVVVLWHLLLELAYLWASGCARQRLALHEVVIFLVLDALPVIGFHLDMVFFCVTYLSRSQLCWPALVVSIVGRMGAQWLLGILLAREPSQQEALIHWHPRHMLLMHTVVLRQLLHMQRDDDVQLNCLWLVLPLLKCALEDLPQFALHAVYIGEHCLAPPPVLVLSAATSLASAGCAVAVARGHARRLEIRTSMVVRAAKEALLGRTLANGRSVSKASLRGFSEATARMVTK